MGSSMERGLLQLPRGRLRKEFGRKGSGKVGLINDSFS